MEEKILQFQKTLDNQNSAEYQGKMREVGRWAESFSEGKRKSTAFETESKESKKSKERFLVLISLFLSSFHCYMFNSINIKDLFFCLFNNFY